MTSDYMTCYRDSIMEPSPILRFLTIDLSINSKVSHIVFLQSCLKLSLRTKVVS